MTLCRPGSSHNTVNVFRNRQFQISFPRNIYTLIQRPLIRIRNAQRIQNGRSWRSVFLSGNNDTKQLEGQYQETSYDSRLQSSGSNFQSTKARTVQYGLMDSLQGSKADIKSSLEGGLESLGLLSLMKYVRKLWPIYERQHADMMQRISII